MTTRRMIGALALAALGWTGCAARAGDLATLNPLGFSADGRVFAFEQYGVRDGAGFPYAEMFFLDLDADAFLKPSPIRVLIEDEAATVEKARADAKAQAAGLLRTYRPEMTPGLLAAMNPPTETSADPHRIAFLPRAVEPSPDVPVALTLETIPFAGAAHCMDVGALAGYRLTRRVGTGAATVLHADEDLPESRGCPLDYRLAAVLVFGGDAARRAVAIIGVESIGFEGPDLRFIAEPVPLD